MIGYHPKKQNYFFKSNVEKYFLQYTTASVPVKEFIYASHVFFSLIDINWLVSCIFYILLKETISKILKNAFHFI